MVDCGTAEEDGTVTLEAPARPRVGKGHREAAKGVGLRPGGKRPEEPPNPTVARAQSVRFPGGKVRRGQAEGVLKRQGSRRAA